MFIVWARTESRSNLKTQRQNVRRRRERSRLCDAWTFFSKHELSSPACRLSVFFAKLLQKSVGRNKHEKWRTLYSNVECVEARARKKKTKSAYERRIEKIVSATMYVFLQTRIRPHADCQFLVDRTIGRAFGTVCRLSVCLSSVCLWRFVLWQNGTS